MSSKLLDLFKTDSFVNIKFKTTRGSVNSIFEFSLADLPCLNPYEWITLLHFLMQYEKKYEPVVSHIKRMLVLYMYEVAKFDVEIASVLRKKSTVLPHGLASDIENMQMGKIETDNWTVLFQRESRERGDIQKCVPTAR